MGQIGQVYPPGNFISQSKYSYPGPTGRIPGSPAGLRGFGVPATDLFVVVSPIGLADTGIVNYGADFGPDTPGTQTSGIQEAINYVRSFANSETAYLPEIYLMPGTYLVHNPIYLKYTLTDLPAEVINSPTGNSCSVSAPCLVGLGNVNGQGNYTPTGSVIKAASDFPKGEYLYALLLPSSAWYSGATNPQWVGGKLENIISDCNNLAAGVMLQYFGNGTARRLSIRNPTVPNPVITKAPDSAGQSLQTGAFVYGQTDDSGEFTSLSDIQIRGGSFEDGFVIQNAGGGGQLIGANLWQAGGAQRYGFNLSCYDQFPIILINPETDSAGGWTGSVPSTNPTAPQAAGYFIQGTVKIINNNTFIGIQGNYPYIFNLGALYIDGGYYRATGNQYVIVTSSNTTVVESASIEYNSSSNGVFQAIFADNNSGVLTSFKNITYIDDNSGTPTVAPYNINWGSNPPWYSNIHIDPFFDNRVRYFGGFPPSLSANPPVSGTIYQNQHPTKIKILLPVYATTSGTAGKVAVAMGYNQSGTNPPTIPTLFTKYINGSTSSTATELVSIEVPAGWYYSFTGTGITFGTATVEAI